MKRKAKAHKAANRVKTGFRGPSPDVGAAYQFKPGQSGNPDGRPKSKPLTDALLKILRENPLEAQKIARAMLKKVRAGSVKHFTAIADRIEGKPVQPIEGTGGEDGKTLEMTVNVIAGRAPTED